MQDIRHAMCVGLNLSSKRDPDSCAQVVEQNVEAEAW